MPAQKDDLMELLAERYCELIGISKVRRHPREWACRQLAAMCEEMIAEIRGARAELRKALITADSPDPLSRMSMDVINIIMSKANTMDRQKILMFLKSCPVRLIQRPRPRDVVA